MKNLKIYILLLITGLTIYGCDNPAPTQLIQDSSTQGQVKVEVVTKDTGNVYYNNGFDTTGVAQQSTNYSNIITVSGTKVTREDETTESAFAQVLFFDTSHPIKSPMGDTLGFLTMSPGIVMFNGIPALQTPYRIRYNGNGLQIDTLLGKQYLLIDNGNVFSRLFFRYNSQIHFQYIPRKTKPISFDIPTPPEITGKVKLTGRLSNKNLNAVVQWDKSSSTAVELIIGAITSDSKDTYPLFKLESKDNGSITVPSKLLNAIPPKRYDKLVFTLVRKIETNNPEGDSNLHVLSQSIHTIILDIP